MVRLWERAIRRTEIPAAYTEGFNIRQKLSFGPPLSLGITSDFELLDIFLDKWINPDSVAEILNKTLPQGIKIYKAEEVLLHLPSLTAAIKTAVYSAEIGHNIKNAVQDKIAEIINKKEIIAKRKDKTINIRPYIINIEQHADSELRITVKCDNFGTLKAQEINNLFDGAELGDLKRIELL